MKVFIVVGKENSQLWGKCHVSVISLSFLYSIYALKKLPSFILTLAVGCYYASPHEKASGFRIPECENFCLSNPKSRKCLVLDSGIVCIEIRKTAQWIWIPFNDCNPESKLHWSLESGIGHDLESRIQDWLGFPYMGQIFNAGRYFVLLTSTNNMRLKLIVISIILQLLTH